MNDTESIRVFRTRYMSVNDDSGAYRCKPEDLDRLLAAGATGGTHFDDGYPVISIPYESQAWRITYEA